VKHLLAQDFAKNNVLKPETEAEALAVFESRMKQHSHESSSRNVWEEWKGEQVRLSSTRKPERALQLVKGRSR
jgi:hypothetical protein